MDLSFSFERMAANAAPAPVSADLLLGALAAEQACCATAVAATRLASRAAPLDTRSALIAMFGDSSDLAAAANALCGSFHPRIAAAAAGKAGSTLMKAGFTFAF